MNLRQKIVGIISLSLLMLLCANFIGSQQLWRALMSYEKLIDVNMAQLDAVVRARADVKTGLLLWKDIILPHKTSEDTAKAVELYNKQMSCVERDVDNVRSLFNSDQEPQNQADNQSIIKTFDQFAKAQQDASLIYQNVLKTLATPGVSTIEADQLMSTTILGLVKQLEGAVSVLTGRISTIKQQNALIARAAYQNSALIAFGMMGFAIAFAWWLTHKLIVQRTQRISDELHYLAQGDFSRPLSVDSVDEIGEIFGSLQKMQKEVGDLLIRLQEFCQQLHDSLLETMHLSKGSTDCMAKQKQDTLALVQVVDQLAAFASQVSKTASTAAQAASEADGEALAGRTLVNETNQALGALSSRINGAALVINKVEEHSSQIGTILDVIRGIAEQTNLLALNAAIEAARAGEQGRGFAVVADEVRTLAQKTQQSTAEIQSMIERLQAGTREAVQVMDAGREQANQSLSFSGKAASAIDKISQVVQGISQKNAQIASGSQEQEQVVANLNRSVGDLQETAHLTTASQLGIEQATEKLNTLTDNIKTLIGHFKINNH